MEDFRIEQLGNGVCAVVSREHGFGTDAVLLADFAAPKKNERCCDLGSGCGIIPLLWCRQELSKPVAAVEIQSAACSQLQKAAELSGLKERIEIFNEDLRNLKEHPAPNSFNLISMNPPYKAEGAGIPSKSEFSKIARHETMCSLAEICRAAARLLCFSGRFCLCIRPERTAELFCTMSNAGIEPKRMRLVAKEPGAAPWLLLAEGKKGARPSVQIQPTLYVYKPGTNEYSDEMKKIYTLYESMKG